MKELIPRRLKYDDILINLGNGYFNEYDYDDYEIINRVEAIRKCSNKKEMFRILINDDVSCVSFYEGYDRKRKALELIRRGYKLVLRKGKRIKITNSRWDIRRDWWDYFTIWEEKREEWRILMFKGEILRRQLKDNIYGEDILKKENCEFRQRRLIRGDIARECRKAVESLGIDLCGIDVMRNTDGEVKILEVNSGMGMNENSINKVFNEIEDDW